MLINWFIASIKGILVAPILSIYNQYNLLIKIMNAGLSNKMDNPVKFY